VVVTLSGYGPGGRAVVELREPYGVTYADDTPAVRDIRLNAEEPYRLKCSYIKARLQGTHDRVAAGNERSMVPGSQRSRSIAPSSSSASRSCGTKRRSRRS